MSTPEQPWFESRGPLEHARGRFRRGECTREEFALLEQLLEKGYVRLERVFEDPIVDALSLDLEQLWEGDHPFPLVINDVTIDDGSRANLTYTEVMKHPVEARRRFRDRPGWRVQGFHHQSRASREIFDSQALKRWVSFLLGCPSSPAYTSAFWNGSQVFAHQDTPFFSVAPHGSFLMTAWIACEDVHPESGPVFVSPGSHREAPFAGLTEYPRVYARHFDSEKLKAYVNYTNEIASRYPRERLTCRKGEVVIMHGMLVHGGTPVANPSLTRRSQVVHFIPDGMDIVKLVRQPFVF